MVDSIVHHTVHEPLLLQTLPPATPHELSGTDRRERHVPRLMAAKLLGTVVLLGLLTLGAGCGAGSPDASPSVSSGPVWERLEAPPRKTEEATLLAAGSRLLLYGGCAHDYNDSGGCGRSRRGLSFDTETEAWGEMPRSPTGVSGPPVWTGEEAITISSSLDRPLHGLAYDPAGESWRELPDGPLALTKEAVVWTGEEVIVWGGPGRNGVGSVGGAAYDPASDNWRTIARAPVRLNQFDLLWTGEEVIAFGALLDRGNRSSSRRAIGAAYDPEANTWRELPPSRLVPNATTASWLDGRLIAYDYGGRWQAYDPSTDGWTDPQKMPLDEGECYPDSITAGETVVAFYCGQILRFDPEQDGWQRIDGGLTERVRDSIPIWRFSQLGQSADAVYLLAEGITFGRSGIVEYGFSDAPRSFWALRPAAVTDEDTNVKTLKYCGPPRKQNRIRVDGLGCAQARAWIFGRPGKSPVRIPPLAPGRTYRFQGFVCSYELLEEVRPGSGPLEVTCRNAMRGQRLIFVFF